jgi:hypothetical protein
MPRNRLRLAIAASLALTSLSGVAMRAAAQHERPRSWAAVKCERYARSWAEALEKRGTRGLGRDFLDSHEAFLASGCTTQGSVCPKSAEELALANILVILSMNQSMASTFAPFACRR